MNKYFKNNKAYRKGDILLSEEPFAFALKSKLHKERCDHCFKRNELLKCSGCSYVYYCDRLCQKKGWLIHKFECRNMRRVLPRVIPDSVRMLARIIIKLNNGGVSEQGFYTDKKFRMFKDLMSHYNDIKKDEKRLEHFATINAVLNEYLADQMIPNSAELLAIYGKMVVNTFNILDPEMQSIGSGLYLAASVIDHSCAPNAVAVFDGTRIIIRTLQDLSSLNWMNVSISYIELLNLACVRQKELQSLYYFLCECSKCLDIDERNLMTGTLCQNENCRKFIPGGTQVQEDVSVCSNCNQAVNQETIDKIKDIIHFTEEQLEKMTDLAYLDLCKMCLEKQTNIFHPMNIYTVKILDLAMESCIALENWDGAFHYGKQLIEPFRKYYGAQHPLRGIFLMKLGKISLLLDYADEAKQYFSEAATILLTTHGSSHWWIKEELYPYLNSK